MNLSDNLKKIRKDNNLSQEALAEKLGVSRQAVSKWESGLAYPEMDKVLQICNMFNLNIDELLNQNIKEVEKNKQSSFNVNKYIDDFLNYVTKTVNMFSHMKFKDKIKCIFEQCFLIFIYFIFAFVVEQIFSSVVHGLISSIPFGIYNTLYQVLKSVYILVAVFFGAMLILHIFKVRYLDYYDNDEKEEKKIEETKEEKKEDKEEINSTKNEEKIIIRDPKHSSYKFINGIVKVILFFLKLFIGFIGLWFCFSLIGFAALVVLSFVFIKTGLLFLGGLIGLIGCIIINFIVLDLIYSFIFNKKCKAFRLFILFISSLILGGIGIAFIIIGAKDFKYINTFDENYMKTNEEVIQMDKNLFINDHYGYNDVEYIESNNKDIKLVYEYSSSCDIKADNQENQLFFYHNCNEMESINYWIDMINKKVIVDPDYLKIYVYTNKDNIKILKTNRDNYYKRQEEQYINERISELNSIIDEKDEYIRELEDSLSNCE